jgi:DNA-binding response OmpR family regulator
MSDNNSLGLILLVEDHAPLLQSMAFLLEVAGFDVMTARDGEEALNALCQQAPDLIISDVSMPKMDGHELLRRVRSTSQWRKLPFIFASARYEMEDLMYGLELGADDYVPKPFDIYDVLDAIQRTVPSLIHDRRDRLAG